MSGLTYTNPVYPHPFADPFVLRVGGDYYAFGTGGNLTPGFGFDVLHSTDLVNWEKLGGALPRLPGADFVDYWAPEVAEHEGRFFMYYSAGRGDKGHQLRVAVAEHPAGPYEDAGVVLTPDDPFTIDAHPFHDVDGRWYLYYARDFLDGDRPGTALVVDRLETMTRLAGERRTVLRASADWQIFRHNRQMYGQVFEWHTLEGPFVRRHDGRYYCFYSGGAWEHDNYGVAYGVADHPMGPFVEPGAGGATVLKTVPGRIIGPGHNSVVTGPDGQDYIVYHAWDLEQTGRRMCIDRLVWTPGGPRCDGPTDTPQPIPGR
ncbi:MAG TPA: glycoside hydrolase family 43 protein [Deinococcales bacterium]|nr:glycoside hydrolase family 43 protein [Deinococcales bacterium]